MEDNNKAVGPLAAAKLVSLIKAETAKKYDKTGGKIDGSAEITGGIKVGGSSEFSSSINAGSEISSDMLLMAPIVALYDPATEESVSFGVSGENAAKVTSNVSGGGTQYARLAVGTPTGDNDAATKKYVDEGLAKKASTEVASQTANGLMSAEDKVKLDGIEDGATRVIVDNAMSDTSTNPVQNKAVKKYIDDHNFLPDPIPNGNAVQALVVDRASRTYNLMTFDNLEFPSAAESTNAPQSRSVKYLLDRKASKDAATEESDGLMSAVDKTKLDGIEEGANKTIVDEALDATSTNPIQNKAVKAALDTKAGTAVATASVNGLMSKDDKAKLDDVEAGANKTTVDAALDAASENPVQNKAVKTALDGKLSTRGGDVTGSLSLTRGITVGRTEDDTGIHLYKDRVGVAKMTSGSADADDNITMARLKVASPIDDDDAATKKYVDGRAVRYDAAQGLTSD